MRRSKIGPERLRCMLARQPGNRFGAKYVPAIKATRNEAPSISRPSILSPLKLGSREMHLLSGPETSCALLALYNPAVVDIQEQRILSTTPTVHPAYGHPSVGARRLRHINGTVDVARRLGLSARHPKFFDASLGGCGMWVAFPFTGDLLLYVVDRKGLYLVNWNVRASEIDHSRSRPRFFYKPRTNGADAGVVARQRIETEYYKDAGIRTVLMAADKIDKHVVHNLRALFGWHADQVPVSSEVQAAVVQTYASGVATEIAVYDLVKRAMAKFGISQDSAFAILYQAIWNRTILVDLFRPILADRPLDAMQRDVIDVYSSWIARRP